MLTILYSLFDPIYAFHKDFLTVLEARVAEWSHEQGQFCWVFKKSQKSVPGSRIGELLAQQMKKFVQFEAYFIKIESIMREIESALQRYFLTFDFKSNKKTPFQVIPGFYKRGVRLISVNFVTYPWRPFLLNPLRDYFTTIVPLNVWKSVKVSFGFSF